MRKKDVVAVTQDDVTATLLKIQEQNTENTRRQLEIAEQQLSFQQASLEEDRRQRPRENAQDPGISAFSYPEGERLRPKPKLSRETFCNNVKQNEDVLKPVEIEAFNAFRYNCSARNGTWTARVEPYGTTERLFVDFPVKTPDDRLNLPSGLPLILKELLGGPQAVDVDSLTAQVEALQARVNAQALESRAVETALTESSPPA
jgi:hypothetical protein